MKQTGFGSIGGRKLASRIAVTGALALFLLLAGSGVVSAAPSITDWSSTGGHPTNKDNPQDIMYLVQQGDTITFSVTVSEAVHYQWLVNKVDQYNNANTFVWTAQNEKGIYEIRVKASNADDEAHHEWIISTRNNSEAPDIFDYFTDEKYSGRTETDPWGRALPEWQKMRADPQVVDGYLTGVPGTVHRLRIPSTVSYGTWQWRLRNPGGTAPLHAYHSHTSTIFMMNDASNPDESDAKGYRKSEADDSHFWFYTLGFIDPRTGRKLHFLNEGQAGSEGISIAPDREWHEITVTRKSDGSWTMWYDGENVPAGDGNPFGPKFEDYTSSYDPNYTSQYYWIGYSGDSDVTVPQYDSVVIYENKTVIPTTFQDRIARTPGKINVLFDEGHFLMGSSLKCEYSRFKEMFEERGGIVKTLRFTRLTDEILDNFDIYFTLGEQDYSSSEKAVMNNFVQRGGRVFMMGGKTWKIIQADDWLEDYGYGLKFTSCYGADSDPANNTAVHPLTTGISNVQGYDWSYIIVTSSAKKLIWTTDGDTVLASWEEESGGIKKRIVCFGEEHPLSDEKCDRAIDASDHEQLANNIADWLVEGFETAKTGNISGTVTDGTNLIEKATVSDGTRSATTAENGEYTIANVPAGAYTVTCTKEGYPGVSQDNVVVNEAETLELTFTLAKETTPPTIFAHSPTGTNVFVGTTITTTFSEAMNTSSTESAFSISPIASGSFSWDSNKMVFIPDSNLNYLTTYTVKISTAAKDLADNNLQSPYSWQFTTMEQDLTPPVISDVNIISITGSGVTIIWQTDELADSLVKYGTSPGSYIQTKSDSSYVTSHSVTLTGLTENTTYYFAVNSTDQSGKSAQSAGNNFSTKEVTDLIGEWHFDEGEEATALDSSGNNNDGTLINMDPVTDWVDGKLGGALEFDGMDDYVDCGTDPSLGLGTGDFTIEAWINVNEDTFSGWKGIVDNGYTSDWSFYGLSGNSIIGFGIRGAYSGSRAGAHSVTDGKWHHVAVVVDRDAVATFYVDGALDGATFDISIKSTENLGSSTPVRIGYPMCTNGYFNGVIDEVKIYNRALTVEEIKTDYEAGLADLAPPASITNLENTTGTTWINWMWTNPTDTDFSYTMVYLNGVWQTNTSNTYYNATGLIANTSYEIGTHTVDAHGNVNSTWVNQTAKTEVEPDTTSPNITNVNVASITINSATITWDTNEEADTKVTYDTNPASLGTVWKNNSMLTKTHSITLTGLDDNKTYYYKVYSTDASENTANSTTCEFITLPVLPGNGTVLIQAQGDVTDNRLKEASPDTVLGSSNYIDVGRISSVGNYRDVIWFDLSQLNSTDLIKTAKLSLFWYYVGDTRNMSTTVEIYRPVDWAETYVTWNSRTDGVAWNNPGGDWYDKNIVAQGNTPYAAVTLPLGAPDNAYHEFDVTELVQSYVSGLYENTGFFIKTNEVSDSYIAFRSSDWTNADERPKLVVSYGSGGAQQNTLSGAVTSPDSAGIPGANVTLATLEGTVINTTQTDSNGNYSFTEISAGTYNLTVTKPRFWPATNITVTTGNTEDVMLWLKGDLNLNGTQADSGDLLMMGYAATGGLTPDWKFDLNGNGEDACAGDLLMLEDAAAGKIELW